jgi:hypothetical protein
LTEEPYALLVRTTSTRPVVLRVAVAMRLVSSTVVMNMALKCENHLVEGLLELTAILMRFTEFAG